MRDTSSAGWPGARQRSGWPRRRPLFAAFTAVLMAITVLAAAPRDEANAAQATSDLVTPSMLNALAEDGTVTVSVTYRSSATLPVDGEMSSYLASVGFERAAVLAGLPDDDLNVVTTYRAIPAFEIEVTSEDALRALAANAGIDTMVRPPEEATLAGQPDALLALNQARPAIEADLMHSIGVRGGGVRVAVVDSGIENSHPAFAGAIVYERCFLRNSTTGKCPNGGASQTGDGAAADSTGHGTAVAGTIASNGSGAPLGVAPNVKLEIYRVSSSSTFSTRDALEALDFILANRTTVDVVNMSWGTRADFAGACSRSEWPAMYDTINGLRQRGMVLTIAAGNSATDQMGLPACFGPGLAVAATSDRSSEAWSSTNLSRTTDISAPGENVTSAFPGGSTVTASGTSFAAPIVAGCAALFMQYGIQGVAALEARLSAGAETTSRFGNTVPWLNCAPLCRGQQPTVLIAAGDSPTNRADVIIGTIGADEIDGRDGNDVICGLGGDDTLNGSDGNDWISGDGGDDKLFGGKGADTMYGGDGADAMHGNRGDDVMWGQAGNDKMFGYSQNDTLHGGQGNDNLHGNTGEDTLNGNSGDDKLFGYADDDTMSGSIGDDLIVGNFGDDKLFGDEGNDLLRGADGDDSLHGHAGNDTLEGNSGNDTLFGYEGNDRLDGGINFDVCRGNAGFDTATRCEDTTGVP